jgi:hypothetical protein
MTEVTFANEPHLRSDNVGPLHRPADQLLKQTFQRLFLGEVEEKFRREIRIEAHVTNGFHNQR